MLFTVRDNCKFVEGWNLLLERNTEEYTYREFQGQ